MTFPLSRQDTEDKDYGKGAYRILNNFDEFYVCHFLILIIIITIKREEIPPWLRRFNFSIEEISASLGRPTQFEGGNRPKKHSFEQHRIIG